MHKLSVEVLFQEHIMRSTPLIVWVGLVLVQSDAFLIRLMKPPSDWSVVLHLVDKVHTTTRSTDASGT